MNTLRSSHALNVAEGFDLCSHEPGVKAPRLTPDQVNGTLNLAGALARLAKTQEELAYPRFLMRVLDNTADNPVNTSGLATILRERTAALTPPPAAPPSFTSWVIQYRAQAPEPWQNMAEYNTYEEAHAEVPRGPRGERYRIIGIVS